MITLITFPPGWGEPSLSPFCTKAIYMLNASGLAWQREDINDPRKAPFAKLPAIRIGTRVIGDSDNIRAYLASEGRDMDAHLNDAQRAEAMAWQRLVEEHIYYHAVHDRWMNTALWPEVKRLYFSDFPWPVRHILPEVLRRGVRQGLTYTGLLRFDEETRFARLERDLTAITTRLSNRLFLFGEHPCSVDASLAGMLGNMRCVPVATRTREHVRSNPVLMGYADRVSETLGHAHDREPRLSEHAV